MKSDLGPDLLWVIFCIGRGGGVILNYVFYNGTGVWVISIKNLVVYYVYFHNSSCGEYIKLSQGRGG